VGGLEKLLVDFARHSDRSHFQLHFISLGDRGSEAKSIEAQGWPVMTMHAAEKLRPALVLRLAGIFRRMAIDVVHTHNSRPLIHAGPAARLAGVSGLFHTRHGPRPLSSPRQAALFRLSSYWTDKVVSVSSETAERTLQDGVSPRKVITIHNGVDTERFSYLGPQRDGPIVMVGRLSPEKSIDTLLHAARELIAERPILRFEIAGNGPCMAQLQAVVREFNLENNVRLLGEVRDVEKVLARASMFVLPSLIEGVSLTLLEAMARGLPVVATEVGGNPEVVLNGETGLLVPPRKPSDLAAALRYLLDNPTTASQMGRAGRNRVISRFDIRKTIAHYQALYRQCCLRPSAHAGRRLPRPLSSAGRLAEEALTV
jgi:glycosyltransferase involved in cell wall biosynthesis